MKTNTVIIHNQDLILVLSNRQKTKIIRRKFKYAYYQLFYSEENDRIISKIIFGAKIH
jgi:hypothetical protein